MKAYITNKEELDSTVAEAVERVVKNSIPQIIQKASRKEYYTIDEACQYLDVSRRHLQHLRTTGQIGYVKNGRKVYLKHEDLQNFFTDNYIPSENG